MPNKTLSARQAIVTARALPLPSRIEATAEKPETKADVDPVERAMLMNRYRALRDRLVKESIGAGEDVFVTAQDPEVSRLQSRLAELALHGEPLGPGGEEVKFGGGFEGRDWFGWLKSMIDWVDRADG